MLQCCVCDWMLKSLSEWLQWQQTLIEDLQHSMLHFQCIDSRLLLLLVVVAVTAVIRFRSIFLGVLIAFCVTFCCVTASALCCLHFSLLPRDFVCNACNAVDFLSVRLSVRRVHCDKTKYSSVNMSTPIYDWAMFLVSWGQIHGPQFRSSPQTNVLKTCTPRQKQKFDQQSAITWKRCKIGCKLVQLVLITTTKLHKGFWLVPKSVALKLEWPWEA